MIRVLVVDDSSLMVRMLSDIINADAELEVIGTAMHGYEAVRKTERLRPDVITMDVNMPHMDGLRAVEQIMTTMPTPIVMISSMTREGATTTLNALELGAIDFISKPSGVVSPDIGELAAEIVAKIKIASKIRVVRTVKRTTAALPPAPAANADAPDIDRAIFNYVKSNLPGNVYKYDRIVAIGCSTGGPQALNEILPRFPVNFEAPILVVQHMPKKFTGKLAELLNKRLNLGVVEAAAGMKIRKGMVYIAPGGHHLKILPDRTLALLDGPKRPSEPCPSADMLMQSVAAVFGSQAIGVILTGMGNDGVSGMMAIKEANGATIAQDEETSLVFGMPKTAIEAGCVDAIVPLPGIANEIIERVLGKRYHQG